ncbi:J domain-containing protein [Natrinema halophilum]|uniref:J domain-containing protein n=1 Tax=Natrinema halophilum TaxID=1699371 RepID=UPI001F404D51|nr:J domain-containing protein [Natrinema halophilum]UHQ96448.1 J domain-containing protein [Natrinema halophilum]
MQSESESRLDWPTELPRTNPTDRERTTKFDVTLGAAIKDIKREMERLEVDDWRLETGMPQRKTDGLPYASAAEPDDPGVALQWTMDGADYAIACDQYTKVRDNTRAIGLYLNEKRKMENRPIATGQSEFATARLPPADEGEIAAPPAPSEEDVLGDDEPHEVLEVAPDAPDEIVRAAFKAQVRDLEGHPDTGGSSDQFRKLEKAREEMLDN